MLSDARIAEMIWEVGPDGHWTRPMHSEDLREALAELRTLRATQQQSRVLAALEWLARVAVFGYRQECMARRDVCPVNKTCRGDGKDCVALLVEAALSETRATPSPSIDEMLLFNEVNVARLVTLERFSRQFVDSDTDKLVLGFFHGGYCTLSAIADDFMRRNPEWAEHLQLSEAARAIIAAEKGADHAE